MDEITKLDNKYLVLKWEDIQNLKGNIGVHQRKQLGLIIEDINNNRSDALKPHNDYLVLNLGDKIDLWELNNYLINKFGISWCETVKVKDIAVLLVNAILKTKKDV